VNRSAKLELLVPNKRMSDNFTNEIIMKGYIFGTWTEEIVVNEDYSTLIVSIESG
jgi:hypothetical protein